MKLFINRMKSKIKILGIIVCTSLLGVIGCSRCSKCICEKHDGCIFIEGAPNPLYSPDTLPYKYSECLNGRELATHGGANTRYNELVNNYKFNCK